jgi:hypothetical protein
MLLISYLGISFLTAILFIVIEEKAINIIIKEKYLDITKNNECKIRNRFLFLQYLKLVIVSFIPFINIILCSVLLYCLMTGNYDEITCAIDIEAKINNK